jgi:hypothetical protein
MSVPITTIQGSDNVGLSRLTINTNFAALKAASDAVTNLLNPDTFTLSGVKSVTIDDTAQPLSSSILSVTKGASILGNVTLGTIGQSTTVTVNGNGGIVFSEGALTISLGDFVVDSGTSEARFDGALKSAGEYRVPLVSSAFSGAIGLTGAASATLNVSQKRFIVISSAVSSAFGLTASLPAGATGQELQIYHVLDQGPVRIDAANFQGLTGSIVLNQTGDLIKCYYDSTSWYLWDYTTGTPGATSVSFNRV